MSSLAHRKADPAHPEMGILLGYFLRGGCPVKFVSIEFVEPNQEFIN